MYRLTRGVKRQWRKTGSVPLKPENSFRMSYSRQKEVLEMPNLIEVQKDSYQWFLDEVSKRCSMIFPLSQISVVI